MYVKLAALFSGGKDSTYAIYRAKEIGHQVVCLVTMHPVADDSPLFHYPNSWVTEYLADAMQIPLIGFSVSGRAKEDELKALEGAIAQAKSLYGIEGIAYGGISSNYQKQAFEEICVRLNVAAVAPLWNIEPQKYMNDLVECGFSIIVVGVSVMGLEKEWLGRQIDKEALGRLAALAKKYGFNLTFEGGEAETLVVDCPLFRKKLQINAATTHWDGQRGIFEIRDVSLVEK
ncbi:putative ATP binding protein [Candidatus Nitrososphaera gargensis Ga9.2]|uniref:Putative ATP binding protein n=1 Tax=Nitrososphaera gargensis (strain Ga9.2) TaxID=1237085 RepID=K0INM1_NITGG|nr:putative ATP binding protein [Candidatus Nitrososphaera gargensis Ga9.2]